jgi:hypothetical protein
MKDLWNTIQRPSLQIISIGEEIKTKGTDNLFNKITLENLPKLEKKGHPDI